MPIKGQRSLMPQHKNLAVGAKVGFAKGGSVAGPRVTPVGAGKMVPRPTGPSQSPLTTARRNNGVPGMCAGGAMKKRG